MKEDLGPVRLSDETEPAIAYEPLDRALFWHFLLHRSNCAIGANCILVFWRSFANDATDGR
jgi:hypothetical protein